MAAQFSSVRRHARKLTWVCVPALTLALLAGCAETQRSEAVEPSRPQAADQPAPAGQPRTEVREPTAPAQPWPVQEGQPMSDEDRERLARMIREAAEAGQQQRQPAAPIPKTDARVTGEKPAATPPRDDKAGCGATGGPVIDLTPLPPDQPQPKFVCKEKKVVTEGVWQGQRAEFKFTIGNEGEAPLAVRIKPG